MWVDNKFGMVSYMNYSGKYIEKSKCVSRAKLIIGEKYLNYQLLSVSGDTIF